MPSIIDMLVFGLFAQYMKFDIKLFNISGSNIINSVIYGEYNMSSFFTSSGSYHTTLPPLYISEYKLYFTILHIHSFSSTFFIELFHPFLWIAILTIYIIFTTFLFIYKRFHKLKINEYLESVFHIIGISFEQIKFSSLSLSCCVVISTFFYYILAENFQAFLTSKLVITSEVKFPFNKIEDLSSQTNFKICTLRYSNIETLLSNEHIYDRILNTPECNPFFESITKQRNMSYFKELLWKNPNLTILMPHAMEYILKGTYIG